MIDNNKQFEYAGFWIRVGAYIIDVFLVLIMTWITDFMSFLLVFHAFAVILFWIYRQATPGKMAIRAKIVNAETGNKPSRGQYIGRYFSYIPSIFFFGIGIFWIAFDRKKQGWHDKLSGTIVIKEKRYMENIKFKT